MKALFGSLLMILFSQLIAQNINELPKRALSFNAGISFAGSGDVLGFAYNSTYDKYFKDKISWHFEIGGTIHDKKYFLLYQIQGQPQVDASVYSTTAGFQVVSGFALAPMRNSRHELVFFVGPMIRYQSTSEPDFMAILFPIETGLQIPVYVFQNWEPRRTVSVGGKSSLSYSYSFKKLLITSGLALQLDSNSDIFTSAFLGIGRRY